MKRIAINPRNNWQEKVQNLGFGFHADYWNEKAYYQFSMEEVNQIEQATTELQEMCLKAVDYVIENRLYDKFHIPKYLIQHIEDSWNNDALSLYGRFDLAFNNGELKMLEYNADTPTSIFEAAIIQWYWLQEVDEKQDQYNRMHEALIEQWQYLKPALKGDCLYFACVEENLEDYTTVHYLMDCATQAGIFCRFIFVEDIGWDNERKLFVDTCENPIESIFKLYPWEWMAHEEFGECIIECETTWIEPSWKMILSNKAILPILWQLFPDSKYLLPAYFEKPESMNSFAKKPILSREGANVELVKDNETLERTEGEYGEEGYIYQQYTTLGTEDGNHFIIGSWVIGGQAVGMGIRESDNLITNNTSRIVPHLIKL